MLPDEAPLLYVLRQHCHVAVKIYLSCVATNIKESFLLFLSNKDLYGTNPWTKTVNYLHGSV